MSAPLVVTRDRSLLDQLSRLAAAAGVSPDVATDVGAALRHWTGAGLVLVGADLAAQRHRDPEQLVGHGSPRHHVDPWSARR